MNPTAPMPRPLQSQHTSTLDIGKHDPSTTILALDFVKAERSAPELDKPACVYDIESDEIKTRLHQATVPMPSPRSGEHVTCCPLV